LILLRISIRHGDLHDGRLDEAALTAGRQPALRGNELLAAGFEPQSLRMLDRMMWRRHQPVPGPKAQPGFSSWTGQGR